MKMASKQSSQTAENTAPATPVQWLNARQASEYTNLSPGHLARLRCLGGGPRYFKRINGGRVTYQLSDLNDWLAANSRHSTAEGKYPVGVAR
jgi:hypothetical protein